MKRILIFSHALELGGAERALIGLLHALDFNRLQVDLFLMRHEGELMQYIPEQVNLLPEKPQYASLATPLTRVIRKGRLGVALGRLRGKIIAKSRKNLPSHIDKKDCNPLLASFNPRELIAELKARGYSGTIEYTYKISV